MRILWCTHTVIGYNSSKSGYNGCGWISSLLHQLEKRSDIEIGIAFYTDKLEKAKHENNISFFPIYYKRAITDKILGKLNIRRFLLKREKSNLNHLKQIIHSFKPDIIHVWGTETDMGLISNEFCIPPVIIHIQGLMAPYNNALLPPGFSKLDFIIKDGFTFHKIVNNYISFNYWKYKAERESRIMKHTKYYFGRTDWDKAISSLYSPNSQYFFCSEVLRESFKLEYSWKNNDKSMCKIISTISPPLYKGMDLILKTAQVLKKNTKIDFVWNVIGLNSCGYIEKKLHIKASEVNVYTIGIKGANELKELLETSSIYFHPSYIDNSPNSVCEAQVIGIPIIAVNVGGVSSLFPKDCINNLIPANDPYYAASCIKKLFLKSNIDYTISNFAIQRHTPANIIESIIKTYKKILINDK